MCYILSLIRPSKCVAHRLISSMLERTKKSEKTVPFNSGEATAEHEAKHANLLLVITLKTQNLGLGPRNAANRGFELEEILCLSVHCVPTNLSLSSRLCLFLVAVLRLYPSSVHYVHTAVEQL